MTRNLLTTFILILLTAACLLAGCTVPAGNASGDTSGDISPADTPGDPAIGAMPKAQITPLYFTSLHSMQRALDPETCLALPGYLPEGYLFTDGSWAPASDTGWRSVGYQRGNERITLYQQLLEKGALNQEAFDAGDAGIATNTTIVFADSF